MNRQRLDAESIRDSVLAVSGKLDGTMGGPGFELFRFKDDHSPIYDHTALEKINDPATWRRTGVSLRRAQRAEPVPRPLDCADPNINVPVRNHHDHRFAGAGTALTTFHGEALAGLGAVARSFLLTATRRDRSKPRSPSEHWADLRGRPNPRRHHRIRPGSTAWLTPVGCCSIRMSFCSSIEAVGGATRTEN